MSHAPDASHGPDLFPTDPTGLPEAGAPVEHRPRDGDTVALVVAPVAKRLDEDTQVRMLAYNGSIPGPLLRVRQGSEVTVHVTNHGDLDTTVHWHGLRLDNRYDGVPHETQAPVPVGGECTYRLQFPDPGLYWYHPHIREDYGQELGLYGNILVTPIDADYWPPVDRDVVLTLDDLLIDNGRVAPFSRDAVTHAAMGRYGNRFLTGGQTMAHLDVTAGEVIRLWLTNTANTRVFNLRLPGAVMKLVGGDSGRVERQELVTDVLLAPSERAIVDVRFDAPEDTQLQHHSPGRQHTLVTIAVNPPSGPATDAAEQFDTLRTAPDLAAERAHMPHWLAAAPDKILAFVARIDDPAASPDAAWYACPMHPDVTSDQPGRCPQCGMKLLATTAPTAQAPAGSTSGHHGHHGAGGHPRPDGAAAPTGEPDAADGIEWEDDMVEVNAGLTAATVHWSVVDRTDGHEAPVDWKFTVGDRVKIRLVNELASDHPMHHPFHLHGAGRFLVLARDGVVEPNLVWKDTVLVRAGQSVDILYDVTHPGRWMGHCHIAEHMQSGMMFSFTVARAPAATA